MIKQANIEFQSNLYESKNPTRSWIHQVRRSWINEKIKKYVAANTSVLEVGTGCGIYTGVLAGLSRDVTTIDLNESFIISARQRFEYVDSITANIETFFSAVEYDFILMSEVLEHVSNTKAALNNVFDHLKVGGHFVLTTPNKYSTTEIVARLLDVPLFAFVAQKIYGEPVDSLGHVNLRSRKQLMAELSDIGFFRIEREDLAFYLPVIAEFGGGFGLKCLQYLESKIHKSDFLRNLLWTQCYVLTK